MHEAKINNFLADVRSLLHHPDSSSRLEVEPVFEAGQLALHFFFPPSSSDETQLDEMQAAVETWNRKFPYAYMVYGAIRDCYNLDGAGDLRDDYFVHVPLTALVKKFGINYTDTHLFRPVIDALVNGTYRSEHPRELVIDRLLQQDGGPSVGEAQLKEYVALRTAFSQLHLNPNDPIPSRYVVPVYEKHRCGIHVYHKDRGVLELFMFMHQTLHTISWCASTPSCEETRGLHVELGPHSIYLINTAVFANVLPNRRR